MKNALKTVLRVLVVLLLAFFVFLKEDTAQASAVEYAPYTGVDYHVPGVSAERIAALEKAQQMVCIKWQAIENFPTWLGADGYNTVKATDGSSSREFVAGKWYTGIPYSMVDHFYDDVKWANYVHDGKITLSNMDGTYTYEDKNGVQHTRAHTTRHGMDCSCFVWTAISSAINDPEYCNYSKGYCTTARISSSKYWKKLSSKDELLPGDILLTEGHVVMFVGMAGNDYAVFEADAGDSKCSYNVRTESYLNRKGYVPYRFTGWSPCPEGKVESINGFWAHDNGISSGAVLVQGYAFDRDDLDASLEIRIELRQGDQLETHTIISAIKREGLPAGRSGMYGFSDVVYTSFYTRINVKIYAVNIGSGEDTLLLDRDVNVMKSTSSVNGVFIGYSNGDYFTTTGGPCTNEHTACKTWAGASRSAGFAYWCQSRMFGANEVENNSDFTTFFSHDITSSNELISSGYLFSMEPNGMNIHLKNGKCVIVSEIEGYGSSHSFDRIRLIGADFEGPCKITEYSFTLPEFVNFLDSQGGADYWVFHYSTGLQNQPHSPVGAVEVCEFVDGDWIHIRGWAADPDIPSAAVTISVYADGLEVESFQTNLEREDLPYVGFHGFDLTFRPSALGDCLVRVYALDDTGEKNETLLLYETMYVDRPVLVIHDSGEDEWGYETDEDPFIPPTTVSEIELKYVLVLDSPSGTYTKGQDCVFSGWIASTYPIGALMLESDTGIQYNLTPTLTDAAAELNAAEYSEYYYKERFHFALPTDSFAAYQIYDFQLWAQMSNGASTDSVSTSCYFVPATPDSLSLHTWVSDEPMGNVPEEYIAGRTYYLCYELLDGNTGRRAGELFGDLVYSVKMELGCESNSFRGYSKEDHGYLGINASYFGEYEGCVTVMPLDFALISTEVSFEVLPNTSIHPVLYVNPTRYPGRYGTQSEHEGKLQQGEELTFSCYLYAGDTYFYVDEYGGRNEYTVHMWVEDAAGTVQAAVTGDSSDTKLNTTLSELGYYTFYCNVSGLVMGRNTDETYSLVLEVIPNLPCLETAADSINVYQGEEIVPRISVEGLITNPITLTCNTIGSGIVETTAISAGYNSGVRVKGLQPGEDTMIVTLTDNVTGEVLDIKEIQVVVTPVVTPRIHIWVSDTELGEEIESYPLLQGETYYFNFSLTEYYSDRPYDEMAESRTYTVTFGVHESDEEEWTKIHEQTFSNTARGSFALTPEKAALFSCTVHIEGVFDGLECTKNSESSFLVVKNPPHLLDSTGKSLNMTAPGSCTKVLEYGGYTQGYSLRYYAALSRDSGAVAVDLSDPFARECTMTITALNGHRSDMVTVYLVDDETDAVLDQIHYVILVSPDEYTICFDTNGGVGEIPSITKEYNNPVLLPVAEPERVGYIFRGWATTDDATDAEWLPGQKYQANQDTTLYAVWDHGSSEEYLKYKLYNGSITITGYRYLPYELRIPDEINGYPVNGFGTNAFKDCVTLKEIIIPEGIRRIGYRAFQGCTALETVLFPQSLEVIDDYAFKDCTSLNAISIPDGVMTISYEAFRNCTSLRTVQWPVQLKTIEGGAFRNCQTMEMISLQNTLTSIGQYAFMDCDSLVTVTIPGSVQNIGVGAFASCNSLCTVNLSAGLENITYFAFSNCTSLRNVNLPETLKTIGENTFQGCTALSQISLPDSLQTIGNMAFYGCSSLAAITIPSGVHTVGQQAFGSCSTLEELVFAEGAQQISEYAFSDCTALQTVIFPASLVNISQNVFNRCSALMSVSVPAGSYAHNWMKTNLPNVALVLREGHGESFQYEYDENNNIVSVIVPEGTVELPAYAFQNYTRLTHVVLPEGLTTIGEYAFDQCKALNEINLPSTLTEICAYAFRDCDAITEICIPAGVVSIGDYAFYGCDELTAILLPDALETIGKYAFAYCVGITSYVIPGSIRSIGEDAFQGNSLLQEIILPEGLIYLGNQAFSNCAQLHMAKLPNSLTNLEWGIFENCTRLEEVMLGDSVRNIPSYMFYSCIALDAVVLPSTVQEIGSYSFSGCSGLTSVNIPSGITVIAESVFRGCSSLQTMIIPEGVTELWAYAFSGCSSLQSLTIPGSVTSFEQTAVFSGRSTALSGTTNLMYIYTPADSPAVQWLADVYASRDFIISDPVPVTYMELNDSQITISWKETCQLVATVWPMDATNTCLLWTSSNPEVVSVDQTGLITATSPSAAAVITAATLDGSCSASCTVTTRNVSHTLLYELDGGTQQTTKTSVVIGLNCTFGELPVPTKENALFLGWYDGPEETANLITAETPVGVTDGMNITLYAHWRLMSMPDANGRNMGNGSVYLSWADEQAPDQYRVYEQVDEELILLQTVENKDTLLEQVYDGAHIYFVAGVYSEVECLSVPILVNTGEMHVTVYLTPKKYSNKWYMPEDFSAMASEQDIPQCISSDGKTAQSVNGLALGYKPGSAVITLMNHGYPAVCTIDVVQVDHELILPSALTEIEEDAFWRDSSI